MFETDMYLKFLYTKKFETPMSYHRIQFQNLNLYYLTFQQICSLTRFKFYCACMLWGIDNIYTLGYYRLYKYRNVLIVVGK